jgi:hypothetical protein
VTPYRAARMKKFDEGHNFFSDSSLSKSRRKEEKSMETSFGFENLSQEERQAIEELLLDEMEKQQWDAITYSVILGEEVILPIQ